MKAPSLCAVLAALLIEGGTLIAQQPCRSTTLITVLDEDTNQPIDGLVAGDFHAELKGNEISIRAIAPPPESRRFVFVLDRSGSMSGTSVTSLSKLPQRYDPRVLVPLVLREALSSIPKGSQVAFLQFAGQHSQQTEFMEPEDALRRAPEILAWSPSGKSVPRGRTPLWDNIDTALRMLAPPRTGDLIAVISDGGDNMSRLREGQIRTELLDAAVPVLAFVVAGPSPIPAQEEGLRSLLDVANVTGGAGDVRGSITRSSDLDAALPVRPSQLITQLAHQYELELDTPAFQKPEKWQLRVTSSAPGRKAKLLYPHYLAACSSIP
ncbi:MAG: vWA domain-containing protein [Terracidiphilus sp.]